MIIEESYEYVPPGGDPTRPVVIHGYAPYRPGERRTIDRFLILAPEQGSCDLPARTVVANWPEVVSRILDGVPAETEDGLKERMKSIVPIGSVLP